MVNVGDEIKFEKTSRTQGAERSGQLLLSTQMLCTSVEGGLPPVELQGKKKSRVEHRNTEYAESGREPRLRAMLANARFTISLDNAVSGRKLRDTAVRQMPEANVT